MTQGYEANHSGSFLETIFEQEMASRGFLMRNYNEDADNLDMFAPRIVVRNVPYISLYGCLSRSEYVIADNNRKIRVECRWQSCPGSVDEKFPYLLRNAVECMPEQEVLLLLGGDGARTEAVAWLRRGAQQVAHKTIYVLNINEFPGWVRKELAQKLVA